MINGVNVLGYYDIAIVFFWADSLKKDKFFFFSVDVENYDYDYNYDEDDVISTRFAWENEDLYYSEITMIFLKINIKFKNYFNYFVR
jgi:hypothetical protein